MRLHLGSGSGSGNWCERALQVGVFDGVRVVHGRVAAEPEQVAGAADVAAGEVDLVLDAVLAQCSASQVGRVDPEFIGISPRGFTAMSVARGLR